MIRSYGCRLYAQLCTRLTCTFTSRAVTLAGSRGTEPNVLSGYGRGAPQLSLPQHTFNVRATSSKVFGPQLEVENLKIEKTFAIEIGHEGEQGVKLRKQGL